MGCYIGGTGGWLKEKHRLCLATFLDQRSVTIFIVCDRKLAGLILSLNMEKWGITINGCLEGYGGVG